MACAVVVTVATLVWATSQTFILVLKISVQSYSIVILEDQCHVYGKYEATARGYLQQLAWIYLTHRKVCMPVPLNISNINFLCIKNKMNLQKNLLHYTKIS